MSDMWVMLIVIALYETSRCSICIQTEKQFLQKILFLSETCCDYSQGLSAFSRVLYVSSIIDHMRHFMNISPLLPATVSETSPHIHCSKTTIHCASKHSHLTEYDNFVKSIPCSSSRPRQLVGLTPSTRWTWLIVGNHPYKKLYFVLEQTIQYRFWWKSIFHQLIHKSYVLCLWCI